MRASAGAASFRHGATLEACLQEARTQVEHLKQQIEDDPSATTRRWQGARQRAARIEAAVSDLAQAEAVRPAGRPRQVPLAAPPEEAAETPLCAPLAALGPVHLEVVQTPEAAVQWDAAVARWHPLGFKGPSVTGCATSSPPASSVWAVCCWPGPRDLLRGEIAKPLEKPKLQHLRERVPRPRRQRGRRTVRQSCGAYARSSAAS